MSGLDLTAVAIAQTEALAASNAEEAVEWFNRVPPSERPADLEIRVCHQAAKSKMQKAQWGTAQQLLERANAAATDGTLESRLSLVRKREDFYLDESQLEHALNKTLRSTRLESDRLQPEVDSVWALGAYISRGAKSGTPISRLIRLGKEELPADQQQGVARVGGTLLCHLLLTETDAVARADVVVAIPANPQRYVTRGWSLPDELARSIERHVAIPFEFDLLRSTADELELRGLSWRDRHRAVRGTMAADNRDLEGLCVLVVDDVITSGATLREAARILRSNGATEVIGAALTHTEG